MDTTLNRTVALKVLAPHLLWDPTFIQRFQREAEVAANLDHPNIVTIYEVSQIEGVYFIAMRFLAGRTLSQILEAEGPSPVSRVQAIIEQIASALDYAHARGLVHRDVKPSNIIVADNGRATLTDFGLVKAGEGTKLSSTGMVFGTPAYMSPEQAEGGKEVDARSDIYSLGVMLFEMLAGRVPFVADTPLTVMYKHMHELPPMDELPSDLPQGVVAVIEKALAKDPSNRFQTTADMVEASRQAVAETLVPAEVTPPPVVVVEKPVAAAPLRREPEVAPQPLVERVTAPEEEAVPFWQKVPEEAQALGALVARRVPGWAQVLKAQVARRGAGWAWVLGALAVLATIAIAVYILRSKPGGTTLFTSNRDGKQEVYRLAGAGEVERITSTPGDGESWSPASELGGAILFTSNRDGKREVCRLTGAGEVVRITHTPGDGESWSPASELGGAILFTSDRDGKREVYRLTGAGEVQRITHTSGYGESWLLDW